MNGSNSNIIGSWKLKAFNIRETNGVVRDWRPNAHGILIYAPDGFMSVSINSDQRGEAWSDSLLFYAGAYAFDGETVTHQVSNATSSERIGKPMIRKAILRGDELELVAEGDFGLAILVWKRP
jgi:hypothetical protein